MKSINIMVTYCRLAIQLYALNLDTRGRCVVASRTGYLAPGEVAPVTRCIRGRVCQSTSLDARKDIKNRNTIQRLSKPRRIQYNKYAKLRNHSKIKQINLPLLLIILHSIKMCGGKFVIDRSKWSDRGLWCELTTNNKYIGIFVIKPYK